MEILHKFSLYLLNLLYPNAMKSETVAHLLVSARSVIQYF